MASYGMNDVKTGMKILVNRDPCVITETEYVKPGKGQAFTRIKFRNIKSGRVVEMTMKATDSLEAADVIVVVAGMDGALSSVVGGLVRVPVIAVPTSVGYGAAFGGIAPLLTMLNSCAAGVTVVNIDNGFGAAVAAVRILHR
jgi:phosphoribosylcarboxyaminoimidazole (NCAIR) mutase